jgi:hypothetical protein
MQSDSDLTTASRQGEKTTAGGNQTWQARTDHGARDGAVNGKLI